MVESNKLNIGFVCNSLESCTRLQVLTDLANGLENEQFKSFFFSLESRDERESAISRQGIQWISLAKILESRWFAKRKLARLLRENQIDILHTHDVDSLRLMAQVVKSADVKLLIHTQHERLASDSMAAIKSKLPSQLISVAVSEQARSDFSEVTEISPDRIQVIPRGIDIERYRKSADARLRDDLGIRASDHVIGMVGDLSSEMDHALLLRATNRVFGVTPNIKLVIVGDGNERGKLQRLAKELKIDHKVVFTGRRDDIPDLLALMDIFVLCSKVDKVHHTLFEALAAGKAIVCTQVEGISNLIQDGVQGILIPLGDEGKLAAAMAGLIQDRSLATNLRDQARKESQQRFSLDKMVEAYKALYLGSS